MSGVWLFNRNAFTDDEYAPSTVTNIVLNSTNVPTYEKSNNTDNRPTNETSNSTEPVQKKTLQQKP